MKKRIISAILVIVMSVMALASCAPAFNFVEDSKSYVTFNYDKLIEELAKIEIEDGDFTTNEDTRKEKVEEDIFSAIATAVIKNALDSDKKDTGKIGSKDVVYYCYYATDDAGNVFYFSNMKEASITASSTKADHVIELGSYDKDDELKSAIAEALLGGDGFDFGAEGQNGYDMLLSSDYTSENLADRRVELGDTIVISYKREYKFKTYKKNEAGTSYVDKDGKDTTDPTKYVDEAEKTVSEICTFQLVKGISIDSEDILVKFIAEGLKTDADNKADDDTTNDTPKFTVNVGSQVTKKEGNTTVKEFQIDGILGKDGKIDRNDDIEYTYSNVKIEFAVDSFGTPLEVEYTVADDKDNEVNPDSLRVDNTSGKVNLKGKTLKYYVFPVYYLSIPETVTAADILQHVVAKNVTATYFDVFKDDYKNGDKTVADLVDEIKALFNEEYETGSNASETHKNLSALKKAVTDAEKVVKDADDKALQEDKDKVTEATNKYKLAQREAIRAAVDALAAAKLGDKTLADEVVTEHKKDTYDKLKEEYETYITEEIEKKVYDLIFENDEICKINDGITYPEKLLKEFKEHLYESYEYEFYNGSYTTSSTNKESNYKHYKGDLQAYLYVATGAEEKYGKTVSNKKTAIENAITDEAKEAIDPLLKLYTVAAVFDTKGVSAKLVEYVDADILAGAYLARYEDNDALTAKQNKEAKESAEKTAKQNEEDAKENAGNFLITDEVFKEYKKSIGSSAYRSYKEQYGEINIRASLQFNRLFYYLTCTDLVDNTEENKTDIKYVVVEEGKDPVISFRTIKYTIVEDDGHEEDDGHDH